MTTRFTLEKRERLLTLLETGRSVAEACDTVSISRNTVYQWCKDGREEGASTDHRDFAQRFDAIRNGPAEIAGLTQADLIKLLEVKARGGHVQAIKLLLERPWERKQVAPEEPKAPVLSIMDKLAARRTQ